MACKKTAPLCAISSLMLVGANAWTQSLPEGDTRAAAERADSAAPMIEEIIVTAQKREELLRDVPITVSVVSAEQLARQHIISLTDLPKASPELSYTGGPSGGYSIRGSGTGTLSPTAENNVSVVVDGVVQGQIIPPRNGLFDVRRVEVLSGPQGTLFGKNASAGVINIVTNAPQLEGNEFSAHVELGENGYQVYQGIANLAASETSALRVNAFGTHHDGLLNNPHQQKDEADARNYGARARYLWRPSDRFDLNVIADYEKNDGDAFLWTVRSASGSLASQLAACGVTPGPENTDLCIDGTNFQVSESYGLSAQVDWTLGSHTLTSITARRGFDQDANSDSDSTSINIFNINSADQTTDQWSQELRLASPDGQRLSYVAGLYYFDYDFELESDQAGTLGVLPFNADRAAISNVEQLSYAVFGQATFELTDAFSVIAGARQTHDELRASLLNFTNTSSGVFVPGFSPPPGFAASRIDEDNFSYRLGLQYRFAESMAYLTYTEGYKGPALNVGTQGALANSVVQPEYPTNLEIGIKTALFDRRLSVEASVYDQTIEDFQAQISISTGGLVQFVFGNASELRVRGVQVNFAAAPVRGLSLNGGVLYNDATYGDFVVPCNLPYTEGCTLLNGLPVINVEGRQLARAPKWKTVLSSEYGFALGAGIEGFVGGTASYRSDVLNSAQPDPNLEVDGYALVDARIGVRNADDRWAVSLFAKNLLDERVASYTAREPLRPVGNYVQVFAPASFRTVGLSLDWRFQ